MAKERFKSKGGFIIASVGAAVGLGNALRFPGMCAKYGGGAYLFIYFIALVVLGVPLLNAEIALGRKFRAAAPECMGRLKRGAERVGWASCVNSAFTAVIYAGLAGWIISMIIKSPFLAFSAAEMPQGEIGEYFFDNVLSARSDGVISSISPLVCGGILLAWVVIFICLKGGAGSLERAAKFTVAVPVLLLTAMAVRGLTYPEAGEALSALFVPDFSRLSSPELWLSALGQVFFSLSIVVGIMPAFGAYLPEKTDIFSCSLAIAAADFLVSVLASVVMFTTLYGCGLQGEITQSGIITAFTVYPVAITRLFGANRILNAAVGVLFYFSLSLMAVQSAVSMLEAFAAPFSQKFNIKKDRLSAVVCAVGALISLIYATSAAAVIVDISDRFVNFYNILLLGIAECIIVGWSRDGKTLSDEINKFTGRLKMPGKPFKISVKYLCPLIFICLTVLEAVRLIQTGLDYPVWAKTAFGWGLSFITFISGVLIVNLSSTRVIKRKLS